MFCSLASRAGEEEERQKRGRPVVAVGMRQTRRGAGLLLSAYAEMSRLTAAVNALCRGPLTRIPEGGEGCGKSEEGL